METNRDVNTPTAVAFTMALPQRRAKSAFDLPTLTMRALTEKNQRLTKYAVETSTPEAKATTLQGLSPRQRFIKRTLDIVLVSIVLVLALPVMTLVAIAIKTTSRGPILFKQRRVGEGGKLFTIYKFRSMVVNAEALQANVNVKDENGNVIHKQKNDPRVTAIGRIIRKTSLDELPQLFNVLKGDMSLVGPRPELPWLVEQYESWQQQRFMAPQGITGWWQVNGRSDTPCHLSTDKDIWYIQNYSVWLDLKILFMTVPALLKGKGAF
jgi:exopolysaccharide biosynthesis polyprenyl glycosylphosphotransferase